MPMPLAPRSPQRDADPLGTPISRLAPSRSAAYVAAAARASHSLALSSRTVRRASRRVRDLLLPGSCRSRRTRDLLFLAFLPETRNFEIIGQY